MERRRTDRLDRREFFSWGARRGLALGLAGVSMPTLLAACTRDDPTLQPPPGDTDGEIRAIVGDVLDFELTSDEWPGEFGFVTFTLHNGVYNGRDLYFIRTDASDEDFAEQEGLVFVPKMAALLPGGHAAAAYIVENGTGDQPTIFSTEPGRADFTPAWRIHRVRWNGQARTLSSEAEVQAAQDDGDVTVEDTQVILNAPVVKWSGGEMPVDTERAEYLGPGQLLEPVDTESMTVTFKLHECYPDTRYIVTDTALEPMAEGMNVVHSPALAPATEAEATGRTNVFMNGIDGPGPMGFQPSVFDTQAGDPKWSPYWDHMTYAWDEGGTPRVLETEDEIHAARDAGDLEEFPGVPETEGMTFVVNCPVPVIAPNTFNG